MEDTVISIKNLNISIKNQVILKIPDLNISKKEKICLIGENGAGKTSLILAMAKLLKSNNGDIYFYGKKVGRDISKPEFLKKIAIVFQDPLLINDTVFNNISIVLKFKRVPKKEIEERVNYVLSMLNLEHLRDRNVNSLSGGESQRVNIARAVVFEPEILFLDEPFSAIDSAYKDGLISDLSKIVEEKKMTLIMTTHNRYEAFRLCDRFIVLDKGKIIMDASLDNLVKSPCNEFTAGFIGYETILDGIVESVEDGIYIARVKDKKIVGVGNFDRGDRIIICLNPESVAISKNPIKEDTSIRNCFKGIVTELNNMGYYYRVKIDCGFDIVSYITKKSLEELKLERNSSIYVEFKALSAHSFKK